MTGVLAGIKVLDLAQNWAGPGVSMYLADQGAGVIKVEPMGGDAARGWGMSPLLTGTSKSYLAINRNKRGMAVDLRQPDGQKLVHELVKDADVTVVNIRQPVAAHLGIDYGTLSAINPRIVYAAVLGYGDRGPYAAQPSYDSVVQGMSGAMHRTLPDGTPIAAGVYIADCSAPMILAYGVVLALLERQRTGRGQKVETSLLAAAVAMQSVDLVKLEGETIEQRAGDLGAGAQRCADGKFIRVAALTERQFVALMHLLEMDDLLESPEYHGERRNVTAMLRERRDEVANRYLKRPSSEWLVLLNEAEIPCGPILTREEVFDDEQILANEMIVPMDHPDAGSIKILGIPLRLSENPGSIRSHAPSLGEHTTEIARELGYTEEQIADLRKRGVVL